MSVVEPSFVSILEALGEPVFVVQGESEPCCLFANTAFCSLLGLRPEQQQRVDLFSIWPGFKQEVLSSERVSVKLCDVSGLLLPFQLAVKSINGHLWLCQVVRGRVEELSLHAQRLRMLGMLAGGVAHDFNNVLAGILGHVSYLKTILPNQGSHTESLSAIEEGGKKASLLTQQILNFSRVDGVGVPRKMDLSGLVAKTFVLLRGAISPLINMTYSVPEEAVMVSAVEDRVAQVLVNIVMNARDALPSQGEIDIVVESDISPASIPRAGSHQGGGGMQSGATGYAMLRVSDNGTGIPEEVLGRVFEPYFSTKKERGTGLGLSTVRSVVSSFGGTVDIRSRVGKGTTVNVYLPLFVGLSAPAEAIEQADTVLQRGHERVLVVDDEGPVRDVLAVSLQHLGYSVDRAESGEEALALMAKDSGSYDLVILDMLMPNLSGEEVFARMQQMAYGLKVLIISGYSSEQSVARILANGGRGFLQKPFTIEQLAEKVRSCLD